MFISIQLSEMNRSLRVKELRIKHITKFFLETESTTLMTPIDSTNDIINI